MPRFSYTIDYLLLGFILTDDDAFIFIRIISDYASNTLLSLFIR
jgi:hypothetical protein